MKILSKNYKDKVRIQIESLDDLWNLSKIIKSGDIVGMKDFRTLQKSDKGEKKMVYLKIDVEKIDYGSEGDYLKLLGKIREGSDDVSHGYHSFSVVEGSVLDIWKDWTVSEKKILEDSGKLKGFKILLVVIDDRDATVALVTETRLKILTEMKESKGKDYAQKEENVLFNKVINIMNEQKEKVDKFILAGPGFAKDNLYKILPSELKSKVLTGDTSVTGKTGVNEAIKRGLVDKVLKESRISKETEMVEKFLELLAKDSKKVTYGKKEVKDAVNAGAVSILLVSDKLVRDEETENMMNDVIRLRGEVHIINSDHDAGNQLYQMGGLFAFLRYSLS